MEEDMYQQINSYSFRAYCMRGSTEDHKKKKELLCILSGMEQLGFSFPNKIEGTTEELDDLSDQLREAIDSFSYKCKYDEEKRKENFAKQSTALVNISQQNNQHQSQSQQQTMSLSFDQVIRWVQENPSLGSAETTEILAKVKEIQAIAESPEPKKSKWEKMKPVLQWLGNKGVDLAIQVIPLILMAVI